MPENASPQACGGQASELMSLAEWHKMCKEDAKMLQATIYLAFSDVRGSRRGHGHLQEAE